ncbi:signal peptidase I [Cryobacterium frigoriphilum]|uniref:Signal peptidase I n=1 Tax=Cryobacterium frigoriphilum TaxID=1259150 RepID=A0A4R9A0B2_9MICO|nr:signal peptidase I [Cryobacterium frigoriphilum]TFD49598.1 signal peptidase I [Cryobacterium frigoriphilum]
MMTADAATRSARRRAGVGSPALKFVRDLVLVVVIAILISALLKTFVVRSFYIPSPSMENTLLVNDRIIVNELVPNLIPIEHGDVVVFTDPGNWLPPQQPAPQNLFSALDVAFTAVGLSAGDSNNHLVKRVIGLPGDTVVCCTAAGQLTINDVAIDEPYIQIPDDQSQATKSPFTVTVPDGNLWVMGDNRYNSADSAFHFLNGPPGAGFVPISNVIGRAVVVSWPAKHWGWLGHYPETIASAAR